MTDFNDSYLGLFEEVIGMADEEGQTTELCTFVEYIKAYLPPDVLFSIQSSIGDHSDSFMEDIWAERFDRSSGYDLSPDECIASNCCECCERKVSLTRHHLFPRETHAKLKKKGLHVEDLNNTIAICRLCHSSIHRFFSNEELSSSYNSLEKLLADEKFFAFAKWASKLSDNRKTNRVS